MGMRKGFVSHDGNGMVGGHWWACDRIAHANIWFCDILDKLEEYIQGLPAEFQVEAIIEEGEDESVGLGHYFEFQEKGGIPDEISEAIAKAPISDAWKKAIEAVASAYIEDLDEHNFDIDEED